MWDEVGTALPFNCLARYTEASFVHMDAKDQASAARSLPASSGINETALDTKYLTVCHL